jgi:hypothetical protein
MVYGALMKKKNELENEDLTRPFTCEEVRNDLFSMEVNKALGPDNIIVEYYQHCWEFLKNDVMALFVVFS